MFPKILNGTGVPALAVAALLFAAGNGWAQKGHGGGGHGGGGHGGGGHGGGIGHGGPGGGHGAGVGHGGSHISAGPGPHGGARFSGGTFPHERGHFSGDGFRNHGEFRHGRFDNTFYGFGLGYSPWGYSSYYYPYGGYSNYYDDYPYYNNYNPYPYGDAYYSPRSSIYGAYPPTYDTYPPTYNSHPPTVDPAPASIYNPAPPPTPANKPSESVVVFDVRVPANAEIWFEGRKTSQTGVNRVFESPPLKPGVDYNYEIRVRWVENGKEVEKTRTLTVRRGDQLALNFMPPVP